MKLNHLRSSTIDLLKRREGKVNSLLALMSILALGIMVSGQFVNNELQIPLLSTTWSNLQVVLRAVIWLTFVSSFATYAILSKEPLTYARNHILELIVCICWIPSHGNLVISLTRLVPLDILLLAGTIAHAWRVVRFTARRFSAHPVFVTGTAALLVIASASALLERVEPTTFPSFWDAAWYSITTITTIGYGDIVPHTNAGRGISVVLIITGVSLAGVFIGLVSEMVRARLLKSEHVTMTDLQDGLAANKAVLDELLAERKAQNELLRQLLGSHTPANDDEEKGS